MLPGLPGLGTNFCVRGLSVAHGSERTLLPVVSTPAVRHCRCHAGVQGSGVIWLAGTFQGPWCLCGSQPGSHALLVGPVTQCRTQLDTVARSHPAKEEAV